MHRLVICRDSTSRARRCDVEILAVGLISLPVATCADKVPPGVCTSAADLAQCSGKKVGDTCSFASGNSGSCATLRCTTDAGQLVLQCVATGTSRRVAAVQFLWTAISHAGLGITLLLGLWVAARRQAGA